MRIEDPLSFSIALGLTVLLVWGISKRMRNERRRKLESEQREMAVKLHGVHVDSVIELLNRVLRREPVTDEEKQAVRWTAAGELHEEIESTLHIVQHYLDDSDVRARDPEYEQMMRRNLADRLELIKQLAGRDDHATQTVS
jgi:hypothetical protein